MAKPFVIGITGGSGSGKTTLINHLRQSFSTDELCVFSQDNYYKPRSEQKYDHNKVQNFDLPESFRRDSFHRDVLKILDGNVLQIPEYTYNNSLKKPKILHFYPAPIVVLEGIFVFYYEEIFDLLDLKIFIDVAEHLKVIRRIRRDAEERNYPVEDVLYRYEHHVFPTFEQYILPFKEKADLIVNNNYSFIPSLEVIEFFLKKKIEMLKPQAA